MTNVAGKSQKSIPELMNYLWDNYYCVLEELCGIAYQKAKDYKAAETDKKISPFYYSSIDLIEKLREYIKWRQEILYPYILKLYEKESTSHDCTNCSGKCHLEHVSHIPVLENYHSAIKILLYNLRRADVDQYSGDILSQQTFKIFVNDIKLIDNTINDLFDMETNILIPKIKEAQKNINVHI